MVQRRFLVASSLARVIERERGLAERVVESFFPRSEDRSLFVRVSLDRAQLLLMTRTDAEWQTEAVDVPRSLGAALMEVCSGHVAYDRVLVSLDDGQTAALDRLFEPQRVDLLTVDFATEEAADRFAAPAWFGRDVTKELEFTTAAIALGATPRVEEEVSNAALSALLDALEGHFAEREQAPEGTASEAATAPEPRKVMTQGGYAAGRSNLRSPEPEAEDDIDQIVRDLAPLDRVNGLRHELA